MVEELRMLPIACERHLTEFSQMAADFPRWQGRIEQISPGTFEGTIQIVAGSDLRVVSAAGNQRLRIRGREGLHLIAILPLTARMARWTWNGDFLSPGQVFVSGADAYLDVCTDRRFLVRLLFFSAELLESSARTLLQRDELADVSGTQIRSADPEDIAVVEHLCTLLMRQALSAPSQLDKPEHAQLEQELVRAVVAVLFPTFAPGRPLSPSARGKLLNCAEDFLRARLCERVDMLDLCRESQASDRTLRMVFRERYGVGPMTYHRFLRLNAVRQQLQADPQMSIADAARCFGFQHLGNFAADYRRLFGVRPSETSRF